MKSPVTPPRSPAGLARVKESSGDESAAAGVTQQDAPMTPIKKNEIKFYVYSDAEEGKGNKGGILGSRSICELARFFTSKVSLD